MTEVVYTALTSVNEFLFTVPSGVTQLTLEAWSSIDVWYVKATLSVVDGQVQKVGYAGFYNNARNNWIVVTNDSGYDDFDNWYPGSTGVNAPAVLVVSGQNIVPKPAGTSGVVGRITYAAAGAVPSGVSVGSSLWTGSATGSVLRQGASSGASVYTGLADGVSIHQGSASYSWGTSGSAVGSRESLGSSSGLWAPSGSASGSVPIIAPTQGNSSGAISYLGSATGTATTQGVSVSSWAFVGSAQGSSELNGVASGQWVYQGASSGTAAFSHNVTVTAMLLPRRWTASISPRRWSGTSQSERRWGGKLL